MKTEFVESTFDAFLKCKYEKVSETNLKVTLPLKPLYLNSLGVVHGGIICSLADIAMGNIFGIEGESKQTIVTADMNTTFIKAATGKFLTADAVLIKKGKRLSHTECTIYNENNEVVAKANGIFVNLSKLTSLD